MKPTKNKKSQYRLLRPESNDDDEDDRWPYGMNVNKNIEDISGLKTVGEYQIHFFATRGQMKYFSFYVDSEPKLFNLATRWLVSGFCFES